MHQLKGKSAQGVSPLIITSDIEENFQVPNTADRKVISGLSLEALAMAVRLTRVVIEADYRAAMKYKFLAMQSSTLSGIICYFTSECRTHHFDMMTGDYREYDEKLKSVLDEIDKEYDLIKSGGVSAEGCIPQD
jgi:hypothetical protein